MGKNVKIFVLDSENRGCVWFFSLKRLILSILCRVYCLSTSHGRVEMCCFCGVGDVGRVGPVFVGLMMPEGLVWLVRFLWD